ncbi:MAG: YceI family protein [Flavobacteriales bacterium]
MKNLKFGILALSIGLFSCGGEEKVEAPKTGGETKYQIDDESISLSFMAYKTTDKVGVKGQFGKINITESELSDVKEKAINNVSFSVPVSSLFTGNESRDWKLVNLFFGVMDKTEFLSGTFHSHEANMEDGQGVLDLTMNGKTCDLPYTYEMKGDSMFISTKLNVMEWNGQEAMDSLNKACYELHKGADGISKTWSEVDISASVVVAKR